MMSAILLPVAIAAGLYFMVRSIGYAALVLPIGMAGIGFLSRETGRIVRAGNMLGFGDFLVATAALLFIALLILRPWNNQE